MSSSRPTSNGLGNIPQRVNTVAPVPPPTYSESDTNQNVPPPSYEHLYGKRRRRCVDLCNMLIKMKKKAKTDEEFNKILIGEMCNSRLVTGISVVYLVISVGDIIVGSAFWGDCPGSQYIPVSLVAHGVSATLLMIKGIVENTYMKAQNGSNGQGKPPPGLVVFIQWMLVICAAGNGIAGTINTFSLTLQRNEKTGKWSCNHALYYYSLTVYSIFVSLISSFLITFIVTVWGVWVYSNTARQTDNETNSSQQPR